MKILLAIDGSGHSEAAIDEVARRQLPAGSEVRILSAVEPPYYLGALSEGGGDMSIYADIDRDAHKGASSAIQKAAAHFQEVAGSRKLNVSTIVLAGSARRVILDEAETFGADLIVVGSHGHGTIEGFLLGSVAHTVAPHARCSVEIVRSSKAPTATNT